MVVDFRPGCSEAAPVEELLRRSWCTRAARGACGPLVAAAGRWWSGRSWKAAGARSGQQQTTGREGTAKQREGALRGRPLGRIMHCVPSLEGACGQVGSSNKRAASSVKWVMLRSSNDA